MSQQAYLRDHFDYRCCCIRWRSPRERKLMLVSSNTLESRKAIKLNVSNLLLLSGFLPIFLARLRARTLCWLSYLVPSTFPWVVGLPTPSWPLDSQSPLSTAEVRCLCWFFSASSNVIFSCLRTGPSVL